MLGLEEKRRTWNAESSNPVQEKSLNVVFCWSIRERYSLGPAGYPINDGQKIDKTGRLWQWGHQIHIFAAETWSWCRIGCYLRFGAACHFPSLAIKTQPGPAQYAIGWTQVIQYDWKWGDELWGLLGARDYGMWKIFFGTSGQDCWYLANCFGFTSQDVKETATVRGTTIWARWCVGDCIFLTDPCMYHYISF